MERIKYVFTVVAGSIGYFSSSKNVFRTFNSNNMFYYCVISVCKCLEHGFPLVNLSFKYAPIYVMPTYSICVSFDSRKAARKVYKKNKTKTTLT